ncbi:MAG TPA: hypothetical protein VF683_11000 [Chthoniobacterales bacterium]
MKKAAGLFLCSCMMVCAAFGQDAYKQVQNTREASVEQATPLDLFSVYGSYVFGSDLELDDDDFDGFNFGEQDVIQSGMSYSHRFRLGGRIYFRAGVSYQRFDFGTTLAPVPLHLQSASALVALEYMVGKDVGAFLQIEPGFYTENDFDSHAFDFPITLGRVFVLQPGRTFLFLGANAAFLRGELPVIPLVGVRWRPNDTWTLDLILPQPRLIYSPNERFDLWVGGQLTGGSFRTDDDDTIVPRRLDNAQVDYSEYRGTVGFTWRMSREVALDVGGGYALQRRLNFERAGYEFEADPAPFVRFSLRAQF